MTNLAIDVGYSNGSAKAIGVIFNSMGTQATSVVSANIHNVFKYRAGEFYKRELPCLIEVINKVNIEIIDRVIIDGHVYVDNNFTYGLGGYLHESLEFKFPVIGVAKNKLEGNDETTLEVYRGSSKKPLYVSSIGMCKFNAGKLVKEFNGNYRIPTMLKLADKLSKG